MSTNPNQSDANDRYGGYGGYRPSSAADDPYGAYSQPSRPGAQQNDPNYTYGQQGSTQSTYGQSQAGQQQQYYQPPQSVLGKNRSRSSFGTGMAGQTSNVQTSRRFAFLSYLGACFTGLFFLFYKRRDPYVRYHAAQSVALFTPVLAIWLAINILHSLVAWIPILGWLSGLVFGLLTFILITPATILWVFLMVTAFLGITVRLPFISTYADAIARRFAGRTTP